MEHIRKTLAIDMDEVIADIETHLINYYEMAYGIRIDQATMKGRDATLAFPDPEAARNFLYEPGFFRTVPVMPGAQEALKALSEDFDIYIVSAAMEFPQSLSEKYYWLEEHFPFITWKNIVLCGSKSIIGTDYLIDDHLKNLDPFKGKSIMFTAAHNAYQEGHSRVNNWAEAVDFMQQELVG